jgi:hypothetical protein
MVRTRCPFGRRHVAFGRFRQPRLQRYPLSWVGKVRHRVSSATKV